MSLLSASPRNSNPFFPSKELYGSKPSSNIIGKVKGETKTGIFVYYGAFNLTQVYLEIIRFRFINRYVFH